MSAPFRCPACGFTVFNRRVKRCEKCGEALPPGFGYNERDLTLIAAEEARVARVRDALQRDRDEEERKRLQRQGGG
jgi:ribosomal protein L37AE/L43A